MSTDTKSRNLLGGLPVEAGNSDNLAIVLCSYFERHLDHPEEREMDDELGWTKWALKKTDEALDLIVEELRKKPIPPQPSRAALLAALKGLLATNAEYWAAIKDAGTKGNKVTPRAEKAAEAFDAAWVTARQTAAAAEPAERKGGAE